MGQTILLTTIDEFPRNLEHNGFCVLGDDYSEFAWHDTGFRQKVPLSDPPTPQFAAQSSRAGTRRRR
jgi:hypothetical protein